MLKRYLVVSFAVAACSGLSAAPGVALESATQESAGNVLPNDVEEELESVRQRLELTDDQVERMRPIIQDRVELLTPLQEEILGASRREKVRLARQVRDVGKHIETRILEILTPDQVSAFRDLQKARREEMKKRATGSNP